MSRLIVFYLLELGNILSKIIYSPQVLSPHQGSTLLFLLYYNGYKMSVQIVTDSTCDLSLETIRNLGITVIPLNIHLGSTDYLDGVDLSRDVFYDQLPSQKSFPKTAAPSAGVFAKYYNNLFEAGASHVLSIHIAESLSATVNIARVGAQDLKTRSVTVLDSGQLSLGMGYLVERAAQMAKAGNSVEEILIVLKQQMLRTYVFASLKTLEYLKRSGRMNAAVAQIGEILKIKPLLYMNQGKSSISKVRTQKTATEQLLSWLDQYAPYEKLAILHAGIADEAEVLRDFVKTNWPTSPVEITQITPALGSHLGIGALGFACVSKVGSTNESL